MKKAKSVDSPLRASRGDVPANILILAYGNLCWTYDLQNCKGIHFRGFKSLRLR